MTAQLDRRSFLAISAAAGLASVQFWMTVPLAALILAERGVAPWQIGLVGAIPWTMLILLVPFVPRLAAAFGAIRMFRAGCWLGLVGAAVFAASDALAVWIVGYGLCGAGIALRWIVSDALIAALSPAGARGRRIGLFETWIGATMAVGPLILASTGTGGVLPFAIGLLLSAVAMPFALVVDIGAPADGRAKSRAKSRSGAGAAGAAGSLASLLAAVRRTPAALIAATACGMIEGASTKLFPVQAHGIGFSEGLAAATVAVFGAGNIVTQYPAGRLADRLGHARLLRAVFAALACAALALPMASPSAAGYFALLAVVGGLTGSLYTLAVFKAGHAGTPLHAMSVVAGISFAYTLGSTFGPMLAGLAVTADLKLGLPLLIAAVALGGLAGAWALRERTPGGR